MRAQYLLFARRYELPMEIHIFPQLSLCRKRHQIRDDIPRTVESDAVGAAVAAAAAVAVAVAVAVDVAVAYMYALSPVAYTMQQQALSLRHARGGPWMQGSA